MTNIGPNLNLFPLNKAPAPKGGATSLLENNSGAALSGMGQGNTASFFSMLEQMPEAMQKVAHAIAAKTESDLNHDDKLALKIFLARMQKELGVKPQQIVQAFSKLTVHDMALPPEATADKFVAELKLDHKDEKKARDLYSKLLGILSTTDLMKKRIVTLSNTMDENFNVLEGQKSAGALPLANAGTGKVQENPVVKPQQKSNNHTLLETLGATAVVAGAVTKSASSSAAKAPASAVNAQAAAAKSPVGPAATQPSAQTSAPQQSIAKSAPQVKPDAAHMAANPKANLSTPETAAHTQTQNIATAANTQPAVQAQSANAIKSAFSHSPVNIKAVVANPVQSAPTPVVQTSAVAAGSAAAVAAHAKASGLTAYNQQGGNAGGGDSNQNKQNDSQAPIMVDSAITKKPDVLNNVQAQAAKGDAAKIVQNNVKELIAHAQFLAHKGGGEMKVSLKPDGLGEVKLNVKMHNGQMSVQMLASNEDAKNVLQKGLGELKTSLAAHHLHIDTIRVDSPKDLVGQFLQHRHQQMEQNFQRRFLSNFQQRNDQNRHSMFDFGSPEIPFNQVTDRASNARYASAAAKRSNRRLDLVA